MRPKSPKLASLASFVCSLLLRSFFFIIHLSLLQNVLMPCTTDESLCNGQQKKKKKKKKKKKNYGEVGGGA